MSTQTSLIDNRITRLERELKLWRIFVIIGIGLITLGGKVPSSNNNKEIRLVSMDATKIVQLTPEGLTFINNGAEVVTIMNDMGGEGDRSPSLVFSRSDIGSRLILDSSGLRIRGEYHVVGSDATQHVVTRITSSEFRTSNTQGTKASVTPGRLDLESGITRQKASLAFDVQGFASLDLLDGQNLVARLAATGDSAMLRLNDFGGHKSKVIEP